MLEAGPTDRPVAWLSDEGAGIVEAFAGDGTAGNGGDAPDVLGAVTFDGVARHQQLLAYVHPHGSWIDWRAPAGVDG